MMEGSGFAAVLGWLATAASVTSFVPQAVKIIRTRETADISIGMYVLTVSGFMLWTGYGTMIGAWPIIVTNTICASLSAFILLMTLLPRRKREAVADALDPE
ncbi:MAG: SemiSWEET family transporter [Alphaproteobacteria bacterium]